MTNSTFYQFAGRFGPTAIAVSNSGLIYVARYEFSSLDSLYMTFNFKTYPILAKSYA